MGKIIDQSLRQRAIDFAANRNNGAGHGYPSFTANLLERGYVAGATAEGKLKDKIIRQLKKELKHALLQPTC